MMLPTIPRPFSLAVIVLLVLFNSLSVGQVVNETAKLLPSDGAQGDLFGTSVAISGTTAVVSAHIDDDNGISSGSAYLFSTVVPCPADFNDDGHLNFFDVSVFLTAFAAGCP